jgi:Fe-S oxidoreductase
LALDLKAGYFAEHGLPPGAWLPARVDGLSRLAGLVAMTSNVLLDSALARWVLEKSVGLSRRRRVPRLTHRTFLRRAVALGLTARPEPLPGAARVAYFVDTFANRFDPLVGLAAVAVLRHTGFAVHVPWRQKASGLAPLAAGDREAARDLAAYNVRTLAPLVRDGYTVGCTEPAAAVALVQEYPRLLDTPDARLVADHTLELSALLGRRPLAGGFRPVGLTVGHHVPCHVNALGVVAGPGLMRAAGVTVEPLADGCSGMAGPWGLTARNTPASLAAGRVMLDSFAAGPAVGTAECSACRLQMQDATGKRAVHPAVVLAHAYGLLPAAGRRIARPPGPRLTDG